ncbi:fibronectin type III domain-containing protein [Paractinoplanes maris]|uniref:fibronectin type III domain-containing protein n=1 Tax=Paractinoplanes maris TaxID=1734446 RepID=UPI0020216FB1|nr:fibronectin type III domain-containing protein [Actinoplanes maris]
MRITVTTTALMLVLAGCSTGELTAELVTPVDIELTWTADPAAADGGQVVEFATEAAGPWTILEFLAGDREHYRHPDLMPGTTFHYRVRPLLGAASEPVRVHLPAARPGVEPAGADPSWAEPRIVTGPPPGTAGGPPTSLTGTARGRDAVLFTWSDNATGEAGQLIEVRTGDSAAWTVAMVLDPDVNSVGLMTLAAERQAWFRVRAFTHGRSSAVVDRTTGSRPHT